MLPPIKFTNVPSVARVETKATFRTPALPQPRRFVPVTCVCTGVPALIIANFYIISNDYISSITIAFYLFCKAKAYYRTAFKSCLCEITHK